MSVLPISLASGLSKDGLFDGGGRTFSGDALLENKLGVTISNLTITGNIKADYCDGLTFRNVTFTGQAFILRSRGVRFEHCNFFDIEQRGITAVATPGLVVEDCQFFARPDAQECLAVFPGTPALWEGVKDDPRRWLSDNTTASGILGQSGDFRYLIYDGGEIIVKLTQGMVRSDPGRKLDGARWMVSDGSGDTFRVKAKDNGHHIVLDVERQATDGVNKWWERHGFRTGQQIGWWVDFPDRYVKGVSIKNNTFIGGLSGASLYFCSAFHVEGNLATDMADCGVSIEYCTNGMVYMNSFSDTKHDSLLGVGLLENVQFLGNSHELMHNHFGCPAINVTSDKEIKKWDHYPKEERPYVWRR